MAEENDWRYTALLVGSNGDRSSRRRWQQIGWEAARRRCCRPVWSSTSSRACPRPRRTLDGQQLDDGLAGGPDSSSGPPVKLFARGGQMVVAWGRCGSTVTQTQVLRAGVPWSSRAGLRGQHEDPDGRATQIHRSSAGAVNSHFCVRDCQSTASATSGPPSIRTTNLARS